MGEDGPVSSALVDVAGLRRVLAGTTVLDVRWRLGGPHGAEAYAEGHVPGAAYVDLDTDLAGPPGVLGRHPLPEPEHLERALRAVGVEDDRPVVVYDDWGGRAAARAWWLLRHHGHRQVRVLDGGWSAWVAAGAPVERTDTAERPSGSGGFTARPGASAVVDAKEVLGVDVVLDARGPQRYRGELEPVDPVAGHVPGARNVPTDAVLAPDGRFLAPERLREVFAAAGAAPGAEVTAYCGSGITACHLLLALEVAGIDAALYPGGWSAWITDPSRPVALG